MQSAKSQATFKTVLAWTKKSNSFVIQKQGTKVYIDREQSLI